MNIELKRWDKVWHRNDDADDWSIKTAHYVRPGTFSKPYVLHGWGSSNYFSAKYVTSKDPHTCKKCHNDRFIALRCCDMSDCGCMGAVVDVKHCPDCNIDENLEPSDEFKKSMPWFFTKPT